MLHAILKQMYLKADVSIQQRIFEAKLVPLWHTKSFFFSTNVQLPESKRINL